MYAIVEIAGQQYKVKKDQFVYVNRLEGKEGDKVVFDNVLLTSDGKKVEVGAPAVKGVSVSAKIIEHLKGDKVIVFKKKRRKGYKVKNGHRQYLSKIEIESIGAAKTTATKATTETKKAVESKKVESKAKETVKAEPKKAATTAKKAPAAKPAAKKAEPKKTEAKKATEKKPAAKESKDSKKEDK